MTLLVFVGGNDPIEIPVANVVIDEFRIVHYWRDDEHIERTLDFPPHGRIVRFSVLP